MHKEDSKETKMNNILDKCLETVIHYIAYIGGNVTGTVQGLYILCKEKLKTYKKNLQEW